MGLRSAVVVLVLAGVLNGVGGCVYYNGMYNANRLAKSARKAERDGRTLEASSLWGQVATKAESVIVRHPTSKYAKEAGLLRGVALARLGQCEEALRPLGFLASTTAKSELEEDALLSAGRCHLALENWSAAEAAFSQLLSSKNAARRREAQFQHARLLRQSGRYSEAVAALVQLHDSRSRSERLLALAGAGLTARALSLADSVIAQGDTANQWDSLVNIVARHDPMAASHLVDRLQRLPNRRPQLQANMLLQDGYRLVSVDTLRAARRFRESIAIGAKTDVPGRAQLALLQLHVAGAGDPSALKPVLDTLKQLGSQLSLNSAEIDRYARTVEEVYTAANPAAADTSPRDLRLFLAAELARDVLHAPRLAGAFFRRIPEQWPASPYAPKAILAAQQLEPGWIDSARALLDLYYVNSPYLAAVRGEMTDEYRQLEDSLAAFAAALAVSKPAAPVRRVPTLVPSQPRAQPAPGGSRVPEPQ